MTAAALVFLIALVAAERLLDDLLLLARAAGWLECPARRVRMLVGRLAGGLGLASLAAGAAAYSLRACLVGHGHSPRSCPDLVATPHLCFDALAPLGELREEPLLALAGGSLVLALALLWRGRRAGWAPEWRPSAEGALQALAGDVPLVVDSSARGACRVEGLWCPVVVVPEDFTRRYPPEEQRAAVLHELGHVRGRDPWLHQLALLYRNIFFFLPGPHRLVAGLREALEERADDWAVRVGGARPEALARCIARAAGVIGPAGALGLATGPAETLVRRLGRLRRRGTPRAPFPVLALLRLGLAGALVATGWLQLHCLVEALA